MRCELQHLAAHQARRPTRWRNAFAHDGPPQRSDTVDDIEAEAAGAVNRQEVREQNAVEQVDRDCAPLHVGTAQRIVAREQRRAADIGTPATRRATMRCAVPT